MEPTSATDLLEPTAAENPVAGIDQSAGNFKYDFEARPAPQSSPVRLFLERIRPAHVWIAASTMPPDEDDFVLDAEAP